MGCINFLMQMNPEMIASYGVNEQAIITNRPVWATVAFVIAVFGGATGCVLLLSKKYAALYVFTLSLAGVAVTQAHTLTLGLSFGLGETIGIIFMPVVVAAFLIWYAKYVASKGWINT